MNRCSITACFFPQAYGCDTEDKSECLLRAALGENVSRVSDVMTHCTPCSVAAAIIRRVRENPGPSYHLHVIAGVDKKKEIMVDFVSGMVLQDMPPVGAPQQCMIFASDEESVVCKLLGGESISSLSSVLDDMNQIFLVSLRFQERVVTVVALEQLSTSLVASTVGSGDVNIWVLLNRPQEIEREVTLLNESVSMCEVVKEFLGSFWDTVAVSMGHADADRAVLVGASTPFPVPHAITGDALSNVGLTAERSPRGDVLSQRLEESQREVVRLKKRLEVTEAEVRRLSALERRLRAQEHSAVELDGMKSFSTVECQTDICPLANGGRVGAAVSRCEEDEVQLKEQAVIAMQQELSALRVKLCEVQKCMTETHGENIRNAADYQCRERVWQRELRRMREERDAAVGECERLRSVSLHQAPNDDTVRKAVQAAQALRDRELDELLMKVRAITNSHGTNARSNASLQSPKRGRSGVSTRRFSPAFDGEGLVL
uniref:Uncharacterized protein n=1 Tax=Trypanosoma congolense (strain IL3000) TaxID=1068625 RepID=G0UP02_TRYCI|nr:conserved hypothetical protein [Trypanosoma congolense IL3000]